MALKEDFEKAADEVTKLPERPNNDNLLKLYALYKQGSEGDVTGDRPSMMELRERAKYDAWAKIKGTSSDEAMQSYIDLVTELKNS